jgi:hypothetical protein
MSRPNERPALFFVCRARGGVGIFGGGRIDVTQSVFRSAGLNLGGARAGGCGIVALRTRRFDCVFGPTCGMLRRGWGSLLVVCLWICGRHGITFLTSTYWKR